MTHPANLDPLLRALVERLPKPDDVFTSGDRERWLAAMDAALQLLYPPEWTPEARRRAKEAREETEPTLTPEAIAEAALTLARAREERNAILDEITVDYPLNRIVLEAGDRVVDGMQRHVESTLGEYGQTLPGDEPSPPSPETVDTVPRFGVCPDCDLRARLGDDGQVVPHGCNTPKRTHRTFTREQKVAALGEMARVGRAAASAKLGIHVSILQRWRGEMPDVWAAAKASAEIEGAAEEGAAVEPPSMVEDGALLAELEAERARPTPAKAVPVQWPSGPIERRPVDPERVRRQQAEQS